MGLTKLLHVSNQLQSTNLDLTRASELITSTMATLSEMRNDKTWNHMFKYMKNVAKLHDIEVVVESMRLIRKRPRHLGLSDYIADSTIGHRDSLNTSQLLKVHTYYSVLDSMLTEMNHRFSEKNLQLMRAKESVDPTF